MFLRIPQNSSDARSNWNWNTSRATMWRQSCNHIGSNRIARSHPSTSFTQLPRLEGLSSLIIAASRLYAFLTFSHRSKTNLRSLSKCRKSSKHCLSKRKRRLNSLLKSSFWNKRMSNCIPIMKRFYWYCRPKNGNGRSKWRLLKREMHFLNKSMKRPKSLLVTMKPWYRASKRKMRDLMKKYKNSRNRGMQLGLSNKNQWRNKFKKS
jgi:hypothetical protein